MAGRNRKTGIKSSQVSSADQHWWETLNAHGHTAIGRLIDDFDIIADQPIPYAHLPSRAQSVYKTSFRRWSDLTDETIASLTARPQGGASTVRAMLIAARDAVATTRAAATAPAPDATSAAMRLLTALSLQDRTLLATWVWQRPPESLNEAAIRLGVKPSWISRHQPAIRARFDELCADPAHSTVLEFAERLGRRLGPLGREHNFTSALHELGIDSSGVIADMFVYLAGPYTQRGSWWERSETNGLARAAAQVDSAFLRSPVPTNASLIRGLSDMGMPADTAVEYLGALGDYRRFGERWVKWGKKMTDRAEAVLHLRLKHAPATTKAIAAAIGESDRVLALTDALAEDPRFARASRHSWALRQWGLPEYSGIFTEISTRIERAGGAINLAELVDSIVSAVPDVAESSVKTYASRSAAFVTEDGMLRHRNESDGDVVAAPLRVARGAFANGPNQVRFAVDVNREVLRGSGLNMHQAVASALGVSPGAERRFTGVSDVVVKWRLSSATGPSIGSLRAFAAAVDAVAGDTLVLIFELDTQEIDVARIPAGEPARLRLHALLGSAPDCSARAALAGALNCEPGEVDEVLRQRGDTRELAALDHDEESATSITLS
ncbi:hypothetical protein [Mycobacterium sp.]|uniref:hypothetical protein n=1 Tax=Mycobacterium sp. TaxID=1785 RepID=UPI0025CC3FE0|nr:hypothetical protein [Mycobacterium sp.]